MTVAERTALPAYDHTAGTGPTLVFLHYWGGSARTWGLVTEQLVSRDTVTVDFRGWGRSRHLPGPYTLQQLAEDTLAVIADAGLDDYVIVGHSMGGKVAQLVAAAQPAGLRGIVLVGSGPAKPAAVITEEYRAGLSHAYDTDESIAFARDNVLTATRLPLKLARQVAEDSSLSAEDARMEWPLHGIAEDITEQARLIRVPALVIAGEHDVVEPTGVLRENLLPYLHDPQLQVIEKSGHLLPLEAPEELAGAIDRFVTAI